MKNTARRALAALAAASCALFGSCVRKAGPPNIVLVSIDTLRADHLGCMGYGKAATPFLDSLARRGVLFRECVAQANWTLPSHVSILTSLYPSVHGVQEGTQRIGTGIPTMAEMLRRAGYATAAFTDGGVLSRTFGFDKGFDLYDDRSKGATKDRRALRWMTSRGRRPFFLFYHTYDVHYPYRHHPRPRSFRNDDRLKELIARINRKELDFTDEEYERGLVAWYTAPSFYRSINPDSLPALKSEIDRFCRERWPKMPSYAGSLRYLLDAYDGGVAYADRRIGKLWEGVRAAGLDGNTILAVTSDHGECFLEHGRLGHPPVLYDEIVRVPLLIVSPGCPRQGAAVTSQVMSIDILPTVLDLARISPAGLLQGRSLAPLLRGSGGFDELPAYADSHERVCVRTREWKCIKTNPKSQIQNPKGGEESLNPKSHVPNPREGKEVELYNIAKDPGEKADLAVKDAAARERLGKALAQWTDANDALRKNLGHAVAPGNVSLDARTRGELRALGYLQ